MTGQVWVTASLGGFMFSEMLSDVLRFTLQPLCKWRQFADIKDAAVQGKKKGDTFHWDVYSDVVTAGTVLAETATVPETNFTITQGTMTIGEAANAVPFTEKLDDLSKHSVLEVIDKVLKNDAKKAFDLMAYNGFNATPLRVVPTGGSSTTALTLTTNGTATLTNTIGLRTEHVKLIVDMMKERNIPPFVGDDYVVVGHPSTFRPLKNQLETLHQYVESGLRMIMAGEIGRYESCRFVEQTNIAKANWTTGNSNQAFFFGQDTVAEGIVVPEEMRGKIPTDYGRSRGVAWYYSGGFALVHTVAANARIVKWDSAA